MPTGLRLERSGKELYLGVAYSDFPLVSGDRFWRPSSGGGGFGDPLERDPQAVLEDVKDGYVSLERARKDYGVVLKEIDREIDAFEVDEEATSKERAKANEIRLSRLEEDPHLVAERYRKGELGRLDLVRHYGVILNWGTGELLSQTTETFRQMLFRRAVPHWKPPLSE
jgi:N-methylhydantoinase B